MESFGLGDFKGSIGFGQAQADTNTNDQGCGQEQGQPNLHFVLKIVRACQHGEIKRSRNKLRTNFGF
jgi:hypothetical protein